MWQKGILNMWCWTPMFIDSSTEPQWSDEQWRRLEEQEAATVAAAAGQQDLPVVDCEQSGLTRDRAHCWCQSLHCASVDTRESLCCREFQRYQFLPWRHPGIKWRNDRKCDRSALALSYIWTRGVLLHRSYKARDWCWAYVENPKHDYWSTEQRES